MSVTAGRRLRRSDIVVLALMGVAGLYSLYAPWRASGNLAAEAYVEALRSYSNDIPETARLVVHPPFVDEAVRAVRQADHPAAATTRGPMALKSTASFRDIVVLRDTRFALPARWQDRVQRREDAGAVEVVWLGDEDGAFTLDALLAEASVRVETKSGAVAACPYEKRRGRHVCENSDVGLGDWMWVGLDEVHSGKTTRRCIWSHPVSDGRVITTFAPAHLPDTLWFEHAKRDTAFKKKRAAPITTTIRVNGKQLVRVRRDHKAGFAPTRLDLSAFEQPRRVEVSVTTTDAGMAHYCYTIGAEAPDD